MSQTLQEMDNQVSQWEATMRALVEQDARP